MFLKRKRSSSEMCSSTSSSSPSPSRASPMSSMDMASPPGHHGRTMKRLRNSRPSDNLVHQRTLGMLYAGASQQTSSQTAPIRQSSTPMTDSHPPSANESLHRFWNIRSAPTPSPSVERRPSFPTCCDDCGTSLGGGDQGMDVEDTEDPSCIECAKIVCQSCSISNLGAERRCLKCAKRQTWSGPAKPPGRLFSFTPTVSQDVEML
ncbi:uncharacterized protein F5Z01DRAFT_645289 [Emericellopsis atlantica]|uniref:Uncharacterized protein n=1 Tax=Emericellopsis atlantica TaxID=2614577 RepID=A0A9P8CVF5_9HYPO|nr:uncharacterized protein F5Z01DRAFT_645289 [Emericellopsis atlantica]KAG9258151.1 hypothetical protein F5Z01DRAFT_645289 [Emericellopsis atlantica]